MYNKISLTFSNYIYTHPFNGSLSETTQLSRYQKGETNLDFTEARDSKWQWHQLGHTQVCTALQTDNHASTSPLSFFTVRMPFLPPNQQCQNTEGSYIYARLNEDREDRVQSDLRLEDVGVAVFDERESVTTEVNGRVGLAECLDDDRRSVDCRLQCAHRRRQAVCDDLRLLVQVCRLGQRMADRVQCLHHRQRRNCDLNPGSSAPDSGGLSAAR